MMLYESLVVLLTFAVLGIIGAGPALWLSGQRDALWSPALYIAPTLGFAIVTLVGFPLVRFVAPTQVWAIPALLLLAVMSTILAVVFVARYKPAVQPVRWQSLALKIAFFVGCFVILALSLAWNGIQYAIYRSNSSDAFVYMSLAETTRIANWSTILNGSLFTRHNLEGLAQLASISPTSLFTARLVALSFVLNNSINLGWIATVANLPVYRVFYAYHLVAFACALPLTIAIAKRAKLHPLLVYLGGAAIVLGFWARYVLETDSTGEISALPLMLLAILAWIAFEERSRPTAITTLVLMGIAVAAIVTVNIPSLTVLIGGMAIYYLVALIQRTRTIRQVLTMAGPFFVALLVLICTGQLDYLFGNTLRGFGSVAGQANFRGIAVEMMRADPVATLWGLPRDVLFGDARRLIRLPLEGLALIFGLLMTAALLATCVFALRNKQAVVDRVLVSVVLAGLALFGFFLLAGSDHVAGKALTFVFPILMLTPLLLTNYASRFLTSRRQRILVGFFSVWLGLQILLSFYIPYSPTVNGVFQEGNERKENSYELAPILTELDQANPSLLVVDVPRGKDWTFAYYAMFAFAKYRPYFLSGLVVDNNTQFQNLWLRELDGIPDYAIVARNTDYIASHQLGTPIASTSDLVLYKLNTGSSAVFLEQLETNKEENAKKPLFPSLEP
jgi:hypothetical protein